MAAEQKKMPVYRTINEIKHVSPLYEELTTKALVTKVECNVSDKTKEEYVTFELQDRTGDISSTTFDAKIISFFKEQVKAKESIVAIRAIKEEYRKKAKLKVNLIKLRMDDNIIDYVPSTNVHVDGMYNYVLDYAKSIKAPLNEILTKKLEENKEKFISSPAAKKYHDNFGGGLLEHTYKMLNLYVNTIDLYKTNRDVMIFLIIEHDMEKINGYTLLPTIDLTVQEELVGHIIMGAISIYNDLKKYNVKDDTICAIMNGIISHHGKAEWGAAKPPLTPEAKLLHRLDVQLSEMSRVSRTVSDANFEEGKIDTDIYYSNYEI